MLNRRRRCGGWAAIVVLSVVIGTGCSRPLEEVESKSGSAPPGAPSSEPLRLAFVPNNVSAFWTIAEKGTRKAAEELGLEIEFRPPADGSIAEQQRILESLANSGVQGISVSPIDPANQTDFLNKIADQVPLLCHDSDAPESKRLAYVGTRNYEAGREAGKLIKEALPSGGKIMLFVGTLDAQNAQDRKKGIEDEIAGTAIEIIDTRTDQVDTVRARSNAEDALTTHADLNCLVGLWSYNGPALAAAVSAAGKVGQVNVVCFDEDEETLQAVKDGVIHGTVVQRPFEMGYQSMKLLAAIARGDSSAIPPEKVVDTGVTVVRKDNVEGFWEELKRLTQ